MDNITLSLRDFNLGVGYDTAEFLTSSSVQKQQIVHILCTNKRSRLGRPRFGCYVYKFLFDPLDGETGSKIRTEILRALQDPYNEVSGFWVRNVVVIPDTENNQYYVEIYFQNDIDQTDSLAINLQRQ